MWEFVRINTPVARKRHKCDDCLGYIEPGEKYFRCDGKFEGEMASFKDHVDCREAVLRLMEVCGHLGFDEVPILHDLEHEDRQLIIEEFPKVAERLGFKDA